MFRTDVTVSDAEKAAIAAKLSIARVQSGEDVNGVGYSYRFSKSGNVVADAEHEIRAITIMVSGTATLYINPLDLSEANLELTLINKQYVDGTQKKPGSADFTVGFTSVVTSLSRTLTYGTDYTIDANGYGDDNNTVADGGTVKIVAASGNANFTGSATLHFDISGVDISTIGTIAYTGDPLVYSNTPKTPQVTDFTFTKSDNSTLAAADHWRIKENAYTVNDAPAKYKDNLNAGKGKVTIEGIGDYSGEVEVEFPIAQYTVPTNGLEIDNDNPIYNGKAQLPTINSVTVLGTELELDEDDYELTADENINAATTYFATIKFKEGGNFKGTAQVFSYSIQKMAMTDVFKTVNTDNITYTGSEITPEYTLKVANEEDAYTLVLNKDFTLVQTNNKNAYDEETGKATIKFVAKANSNFTGETAAVEYQIGAAKLTVTPQDIFASYGSSINPTVVITGWMTAADEAAGYTGDVTYTYKDSENHNVENPTAVGTYIITPDYSALKATNYQFVIDENKLVGQLVISAGELVVKIEDQNNVMYGNSAATYSVSYKSGLSETDADNFDANDVGNITYKLYDANGNEVTAATNTLNVGTYTIKAVPTTGTKFTYTAAESTKNINVIVADGTLTITPRPLNNNQIVVAVNNGTALTYNGYTFGVDDEAVAPLSVKLSGTEIVNTNNAQYTAEWIRSKNATKDVEDYVTKTYPTNTSNTTINANNAKQRIKYLSEHSAKVVIKAAANGNFSGETELVFSIAKKDLNVTANAGEWKYGNTEPTEWTSTINTDDLAVPDQTFKPAITASWATYKFSGSLKATRTKATGESVGEYYDDTPTDAAEKVGLYPSEISATNYNIIGHVGKLTISKGDLVLKVKDYEEKYGDDYSSTNFELEYAGGLTDKVKIAGWAQVVDQTHVTYTALDPADNETVVQDVDVPTAVGSTFKVKAEGATSTNYNITYKTGTYTVVKRPIALKLKDQNIQLGQDIKRDNSETTDIITLVDIAGNNFVAADGDNLNKLIEDGDIVVTIEPAGAELNATGEAQEGVIRATIDHAKYVLDEEHSVWGSLTVHEADPLVISSTDENVLETIEGYNGASNIAVKFEGRSLNLGKWNVMVLPFDVTPYEFTQVLGRYAIFNTLKSANTANNTVSFGLELSELKANEPFLVKPEAKANDNATSIPVTDNTRKFEARTIVYPANGVPVKDDVAGVKFYGAYKAFNLEVAEGTADAEGFVDDGGEAGSKIMYLAGGAFVTATNTAKTKSMKTLPVAFTRAYLDFTESGMSNARIFVEEADGTTTAINGISADGTLIEADGWYSVNGVKLQNAPVEKGVYIHNGKKVVVK